MPAPGQQIHIILDNLSAHKTQAVRDFLQQHPRVRFHFTPTYSPWLKQVEIWFAKIERAVIVRGIFTSVSDLADGLDVPNPWSAPSAALIKAADLGDPVDPTTGVAPYLASKPVELRKRILDCAWHRETLDARLYKLGAKFLTGTTAPGYGIMPGSGLHLEIALLHRIGLPPREAIAAATSNYADIYGWRDVGRIESGRVADILILDDDPRLETSALDHINTLVFRGAVVNRNHLMETGDAK